MSETPHDRSKFFLPIVAAVLVASTALQIHTASVEAQTFDEAVHLTAGYSYWKTGDFRLNQEHPPFAKRLAALPLLTMGLRFDTSSKNWTLPDQSEMGREFLYTNTRPADEILIADQEYNASQNAVATRPSAPGRASSSLTSRSRSKPRPK